MCSPDNDRMWAAPEFLKAFTVSGDKLSLCPEIRAFTRGPVCPCGNPQPSITEESASSALCGKPPCCLSGHTEERAVKQQSMPVKKNIGMSAAVLPLLRQHSASSPAAAMQHAPAARSGDTDPGGKYAAVATPAENGIETATISFPSRISIRFLRK